MSIEKKEFDIVVIGASFAGMSFVRNLPENSNLKVLVIDAKISAGVTVESTGLITEHTRQLLAAFFDIDQYITTRITTIGVVTTDFEEHFFSEQKEPWIYQTDTNKLVNDLAANLPANITFWPETIYLGNSNLDNISGQRTINLLSRGKKIDIKTKFLIGADGGSSKVAAANALDQNHKFLFGLEEVYFGSIHLGPCPEKTIYHFWFGEFSLGYGGWLSSTTIEGQPAFRIGLAKKSQNAKDARQLLQRFIKILSEKGIITISGHADKSYGVYGSNIPIGGPLKKIYQSGVLLIGDAAGFCGAFAADGIKGAVISGIESAKLVANYLCSDIPDDSIFQSLHSRMNSYHHVISYYKKQILYRFIWDSMRSNRTFRQMFRIIKGEKKGFLSQFCDSKEKGKGLTAIILKLHNIPGLILYALYLALDLGKRFGKS
jgi:flavin-dependent dehydrogenase